MATTKPTAIPEWNTGGANRTDPGPAKKILGWIVDDEPPSSFDNWIKHFTGEWTRWISERFFDGATNSDLTVRAPDAEGDVIVEAGDSGGAAAGGGVSILAGDGGGTSNGGDVFVDGGAPGSGAGAIGGGVQIRGADNPDDGDGGVARASGGDTVGVGRTGGASSLRSGDATVDGLGGGALVRAGNSIGTDRAGGDLELESGDSTGDEGSELILRAAVAGTTGSTVRTAEEFLRLSGPNDRIEAIKTIRANTPGQRALIAISDTVTPTFGAFRINPQDSDPSTVAAGDAYVNTTTGKPRVADGTNWERVLVRGFSVPTSSGSIAGSATETAFDSTHRFTVPAGSLVVGSVLRIFARVRTLSSTVGSTVVGRIRFGTTPGTPASDVELAIITQAGPAVATSFGLEAVTIIRSSSFLIPSFYSTGTGTPATPDIVGFSAAAANIVYLTMSVTPPIATAESEAMFVEVS